MSAISRSAYKIIDTHFFSPLLYYRIGYAGLCAIDNIHKIIKFYASSTVCTYSTTVYVRGNSYKLLIYVPA
jgi:hypothetical protein